MPKSGRYVYVPNFILEEINNIKEEDNINKRSDAFRRMTLYSQVGRKTIKKKKLEFPLGFI